MSRGFDPVGEKRPFCVVPIRAAKDRRLKISHLRLLLAIGYYANRAGVCWPSFKTMEADTDIGAQDCQRLAEQLIEWGYMRRLEPNDYDQRRGAWGHSNRYQLLWRGDEPAPSHEEIYNANGMQAHADRDPIEGSGETGPQGLNAVMNASVLAYCRAVEAVTGAVVPPSSVPRGVVGILVEAGATPELIASTTRHLQQLAITSRRGIVPFQEVAGVIGASVQSPNARLDYVHDPGNA